MNSCWIVMSHSPAGTSAERYRCNFDVKFLNAVVDDPAQPGNPLVTFALYVNGQQFPPICHLKLKDFKTADFEDLNLKCRCSGDRKALGQALYQRVRAAVVDQGVCGDYLTHTGWTTLNGAPAYVAGSKVVGPEGWIPADQYVLAPELENLVLEVDERVPESKAAQYVRRLCFLHPGVTELLVASTVVAHLFSLFEAAGVRPRLIMYLVGPSMIGKTTLATLIGQTYNRSASDDPHLVNLISTTAAVHNHVAALSDCACVVDDLYPDSSLAETRKREGRLGEIIRATGNGASKEKMAGKQVIPQISRGVVFATAEYSLHTLSTMNRVVLLPVTSPVDGRRLADFQRNRVLLSTFWFHFLRWACVKHDELVSFISRRFSELRSKGATAAQMDRLADAHRVLTIGMEVLQQYMLDVDLLKGKAVEQMLNEFRRASQAVYRGQEKELKKLRLHAEEDRYSRFLAKVYLSGQIKEGKKKKLGPDCPALIAKDTLYVRGEYLTRLVQRAFGDKTITTQAITAELRRNALLKMDKSDRSSKKVKGIRYLQIPLDRLEEYAPKSAAISPPKELGLFPDRTTNMVDDILSRWG